MGRRNAIKQQSIQGWTMNLNWSDKKLKRKNWIDCIQCFGLQYTVFFPTCHSLITWFELSRVKLCGNVLKGNKNYFELARVRVIGSKLYIITYTFSAFVLLLFHCVEVPEPITLLKSSPRAGKCFIFILLSGRSTPANKHHLILPQPRLYEG